MWLKLQQGRPDDSVIASAETHSVREFCDAVFRYAGLDWEEYVEHERRYGRPAEVENLLRESTEASREWGWRPSVDFDGLVRNDGRLRSRVSRNNDLTGYRAVGCDSNSPATDDTADGRIVRGRRWGWV